MRAPLLSLLPAIALAAVARAASPTVAEVTPRGGQRGTEVTLTLKGDRLDDAEGLLFDGPGLAVRALRVKDAKTVEVSLAIAPDCALGEHGLRLRCRSGLSELRTFWVSALPQLDEKEPNDDPARAQAVPLDVTIDGVLRPEDRDVFAFDGRAGQRVTAELEAMRLGGPVLDARLRLLDPSGAEVASSDDAPHLGQDPALSVVLPADGRYAIEVHEVTWLGSNRHRYRLHLGTYPRPLAAFPPVTTDDAPALLGDVAPTGSSDLAAVGSGVRLLRGAAGPDGTAPLFVETAAGVTPSPLRLLATTHPTVLEVEPNDARGRATQVTVPAALAGVLARPGDVDWFRFKATKGQRLRVRAFARALGAPGDLVVDLYVAGGRRLAGNDDAQGRLDSDFTAAIPEDGDYELRVRDFMDAGGPLHVYALEVAPVTPAPNLDLQTYGRNSQERNAVSVPRCNRMVVLVRVNRDGAGGPVLVEAHDLPAGVAAIDTALCAADAATVPLVLEAAPDAPLDGAMVALVGRANDGALTGALRQRVPLTFGAPNNAIYWTRTLERMAVAVTEPVPFRVRVTEPRAPLVRDGATDVEVVVERDAGFDKPVFVSLLQDSPNTSSRKEVRIEPGKDRATIAVTANGRAALGRWPLVVVAHANAGKGELWASSQVAWLEVASPFARVEAPRSAGAQGSTIELALQLHVDRPFEGQATARLVGLPPHVTAPERPFAADATSVTFPVTIGAQARLGRHRQVRVELLVPCAGEQVLHRAATTELRVDPPAAAAAAPPPSPGRSRLEQLRAEHAARKAARARAEGEQP